MNIFQKIVSDIDILFNFCKANKILQNDLLDVILKLKVKYIDMNEIYSKLPSNLKWMDLK